jgi:hypothetical protein
MSHQFVLSALAASCVLSACVGVGTNDGAVSGSASGISEGFWSGTTSDRQEISVAMLGDGEVWAAVSNGGQPVALYQAPGYKVSDHDLTVTSPRRYGFGRRESDSSTMTAFVVPKASLAGASITASGRTAFTATYGGEDYYTQLDAGDLAGGWSGTVGSLAGTAPTTAMFDREGRFSYRNQGCTYSGTVKARSGVAVYDIEASAEASDVCPGAATVRGVAKLVMPSRNKMMIALVKPDRSDGTLLILNKNPI